MTLWEIEIAMGKRALPDAERADIRNGYFNLVLLGWPIQHITISMCVEADQGEFDAWENSLMLKHYEAQKAQQMLRDKRTLPIMLFGSGAIDRP
jgi:hypothetical protein